MPRRILVPTRELGLITALLIRQEGGLWEPSWEPLRLTSLAEILPVIPRETIELALLGHSRPMAMGLGLSPEGALHKIPKISQVCSQRKTCNLWSEKECFPLAKKMPWCFQPEGLPLVATDVISAWRERVYVVIVLEDRVHA